MTWLMIEGRANYRDHLLAAGIPVETVHIEAPRRTEGIAFPAENLARALNLIGIEQVEPTQHETDRAGVRLLEIEDESATVQRERSEADLLRSREHYVNACCRRANLHRESLLSDAHACQRRLNDYQRSMTEQLQRVDDLRRQLKSAVRQEKPDEQAYGTEFDKLLEIDGIVDVRVTENTISIFTEQIEIEHESERGCECPAYDDEDYDCECDLHDEDGTYEIGEFRIDLHLQNLGTTLAIENLTAPQNGYPHPHISNDGTVCLGNFAEGVAKLLATYEFAILGQVLIEFLRSYNEFDPYHRIHNWPRI